MLETLILAGADPDPKDRGGSTPLHFACLSGLAHVQKLVDAGASINCQDGKGGIGLGWAACFNKVDIGEYLIEAGSNKNHTDIYRGDSPLHTAISSHAHEFLEMLIDRDVDVTILNKDGHSILHILAQSGDQRTLEVLQGRAHKLRDLDTAHQGRNENTPRDIARNRVGGPDGFADDFERLVRNIESLRNDRQVTQQLLVSCRTTRSMLSAFPIGILASSTFLIVAGFIFHMLFQRMGRLVG